MHCNLMSCVPGLPEIFDRDNLLMSCTPGLPEI
jgi:hypothetical protein